MTTQQAWTDRMTMINLFRNLNSCLDNFKIFAKEAEKFKIEVLDDPIRKADMKILIDEDPDWNMTKILNKYNEFKAIYDYLTR